jgi:pimeloyl-ACP methyl ester carboxylesterase
MLLLMLLALAGNPTIRHVSVAPADSVTVAIAGQGDPVVLVPGLFGSAYAFRKLTPLLHDAGYQTIIIEPLGIGESGRSREADYSLTAQAQRLAIVLDTLGLRDVIVVAHSHGGSISFRLAVLHPDLVAGIVSLEGGPAEEAASPGFRRAMKVAPLLKLVVREGMARRVIRSRLVAASGDSTWITEEVVTGYTSGLVADIPATIDAYVRMAESTEPWSLAERLKEIACPVRLVVGGAPHEGAVPDEEVELMARSLVAFAIDSVPDVGHFAFEEQPSAVAASVGWVGKGR